MDRRRFLQVCSASCVPLLGGCLAGRVDPFHVLIRSDVITSLEKEQEVLAKAKLGYTADNRIRVLYVRGSPYERGYQHGALLREAVTDNIGYLHEQAIKKFRSQELLAEVYERIRPFIQPEYIEEMHGLAHGAKLPLEVVHQIHALPSLSEWGGKKRIKKLAKAMASGEFGTSCSNISLLHGSTEDNKIYSVRVLDWGLHRISKLHQYPLITVGVPDSGFAYANIGWVGFIGAVSGMNEKGITLGEMGYGDPENETLRGKPMIFLLREILSQASSLADVRRILKTSIGTNSFGFVMTDGKTGEAELYIKDRERFRVFRPGTTVRDKDEYLPAVENIVYGGHYEEKIHELLSTYQGKISPELLMEFIIPEIAMKSNFQNVVYDPKNLKFWVSNASGVKSRAAEQPYTIFDFGGALAAFRS